MKTTASRTILGLGLVATVVTLTGCVVAIGSSRGVPARPPAPPAVVVTDSGEAATIAEIDAAAHLNVDDDRAHALAQIAERGTLAVPVQVHLVNTAYRSLNLADNKTQVLSKIIARPDFNDATRHAIVSQLNRLSFDNNRQQILQQINERLKAAPAR